MAKIVLRAAAAADLEQLQRFPIRYNFRHDIEREICGEHASCFLWLVCEREGEIVAFHRSMMVAGWAFMGGVHVARYVPSKWLLLELARSVMERHAAIKSLLGMAAWADSPTVPKALLLEKLGFERYAEDVHRFIFRDDSLRRLVEAGRRCGPRGSWVYADHSHSALLSELAMTGSSFLGAISIRIGGLPQWLVHSAVGEESALLWWRHGNTVEVHLSLSRSPGFDITEGVAMLAVDLCDDADMLKISVCSSSVATLLRLMLLSPATYQHGHVATLYRLPQPSRGCHV
jgi:hypothetical protein